MSEKWDIFFEQHSLYNVNEHERTQKPVRIPDELFKVIRRDIRKLEDIDIKISFNDYVVLSLMVLSNSQIKDGRFTWIKGRNGGNLDNYIKSKPEWDKPSK